MKDIQDKFVKICKIIKEKESVTYGVNGIETELLNLLNFIKANIAEKKYMEDFLIEIVKGVQLYPMEIVFFTMRELKWEKVKEVAIAEKSKTDDWRIISAMNNVIAVYEPVWEDADLYEYYSKEAKG